MVVLQAINNNALTVNEWGHTWDKYSVVRFPNICVNIVCLQSTDQGNTHQNVLMTFEFNEYLRYKTGLQSTFPTTTTYIGNPTSCQSHTILVGF